jgi:hypothetical protein
VSEGIGEGGQNQGREIRERGNEREGGGREKETKEGGREGWIDGGRGRSSRYGEWISRLAWAFGCEK